MPQTKVLTAHIPISLAKKVDKLSKRMERPRAWIVKQALKPKSRKSWRVGS